MTVAQLIFGVLTVLTSFGVVFSRQTLYSALWLVVTFFLVGIHYGLLGAHFLANLQILVYAGAIMVLVVFVILLLGLNEKGEPKPVRFPVSLSALLVGAFVGIMVVGVVPFATSGGQTYIAAVNPELAAKPLSGSPQELGSSLFGKFLFPFEIVSVLLLAGVIGAVLLAYEPKRPLAKGRGLKAKQREYGHVVDAEG